MKQSRLLTTLKKQLFKYIVGSGENLGNLFPHNVFYPVEDKLKHWKKIYLVVCKIKCFLFGDAQNFIIGKELTLYRTIPTLMTLRKKPFENYGKGRKCFSHSIFYPSLNPFPNDKFWALPNDKFWALPN